MQQNFTPNLGQNVIQKPLIRNSLLIAGLAGILFAGILGTNSPHIYSISGHVFADTDGNNLFERGESPLADIKILIYQDADANNLLSPPDILVDSVFTDKDGKYIWETTVGDDYILSLESSSLPPSYHRTRTKEMVVPFISDFQGLQVEDNDIGISDSRVFQVQWKDVSAEKEGEDINIYWTTTRETNSEYFVVERSADGGEFSQIGVINAKGTNGEEAYYAFTDRNATQGQGGNIQYRIKFFDNKGTFEYSQIVEVTSGNRARISARIFPNPVSDKAIITYNLNTESPSKLRIVNSAGQVILSRELPGNNSEGEIPIDVSGWEKGIYYAQIYDAIDRSLVRFDVR